MARNGMNRPAPLSNENAEIDKEVSDNFVDVQGDPERTNPTQFRSKEGLGRKRRSGGHRERQRMRRKKG